MDRHPIINWRIRRDDYRIAFDFMSARGCNARSLSTFDFVGVSSRKDFPSVTLNCPRQPGQILQRMKLSLSREMKTWSSVPEFDRRPIQPAYVNKSRAMSGRQLIFQHLQWPIPRTKS